jgi:hypothetical protein
MTRRERLEAKAAKREEWAGKAEARAAARFKAADPSEEATGIPYGQPILVGHHSERRHRAVLDKIARNMTKGCEESALAKHHASKADGLAHQLDTSIFSDDPDAVERLEDKRTELEQRRDWMKSANAYYKKHQHLTGWDGPEAMARDGLRTLQVCPYHGAPFPSYALTNIGATIRAAKKRAESIPREAARLEARQAEAEAAGGCLITYTEDREYCSVMFSEKPARAVLVALRAAYFCWSGGSWSGPVSRLPAEVVAELATLAALSSPPRAVVGVADDSDGGASSPVPDALSGAPDQAMHGGAVVGPGDT